MGGFANNAPIVTDGLVFYVDAGNGNSYPGSGTTWSDLVGGNDGALTNGPTYDSGNGGSIVFDGVDDVVLVTGDITNLINDYSVDIWWDCNDGEPRLYYSRSSGGVTISSRGTDGFKLTKFGVVFFPSRWVP
jgi:hypothetical protein